MSKKSIGIIKDYTPNFSFKIPNFNIATWHDFIESNFRSIDALFYNLFGINNFKGEWTKITSYKAGDVIFIGEDKDINGKTTDYSGRLVKVLKDHTTDNSDYFNIFYALHPDYYELFFDANNAEYFSEKAFEYKNEANNYLKASQELNSLYEQYLADTQTAKTAAQKSEQNAKTSEQNAVTASTTAVNTVKTATDLLNSTQTFTENAVKEINNTKNETISTITDIKDEVSQQIDEKIAASEQIIDEKIETAQNELDTTITNAIIAAKDEVKQEADIAIENASTIAADYAKVKLDTYVDEIIEPPLQNFVDSAESFKNDAENSKNLAKTEATNSANSANLAKISEQNAKTYENSTNNYKNDAQTYANTSKSWADKAEQAAEDCQAIKNSLGVVYEFKGSVQTVKDLPTNANIGDVYNIIETGANYAKIENGWDSLGIDIDLSVYATKDDVDRKQDKLTAGTGIKIENNVVSNTLTSAEWGNIKGTLSNQTDLQNALNNKVSKSGDETISGQKTFNEIIIRNQPFSERSAHTIRAVDTNGKGRIMTIPYYANNTIYHRITAENTTSGKKAMLDVMSKDNGVTSLNSNSIEIIAFMGAKDVLIPTPSKDDNSQRAVNTAYLKSVLPTITYWD